MIETPGLGFTILAFLVLITPLVFVHEWGHYIVGRMCGVKVEVFSIGFGPELFGWNDRNGTRWKVSMLPFGGYVRFYGDASGASDADHDAISEMSPEQKAVCFHHKPIWQRAAIVAAGPLINIVAAVLILAGMYVMLGQPYNPATVTGIQSGSRAEMAGIQLHDRIVAIDGKRVDSWDEVYAVTIVSAEKPLRLVIERGDQTVALTATPKLALEKDIFGKTFNRGLLGISHAGYDTREVGPGQAVGAAANAAWTMVRINLTMMGQVITGKQTLDVMGGPVKMAKIAGVMANAGLIAFIGFAAGISLMLGVVNLFPIPMLDGGHLLFYAIEAVRRKPLSRRLQEIASISGLMLVVSLLVLLTWNDLS